MIARRRVLAGGAAACAGLLGRSAFAQAGWPSKPIRLVIGYAPGGGADITARELTAPISKLLGQAVVVDYKAGAGGTLAAQEVARAAPDGYTLGLLDNAPMTIAPALRSPGYDPVGGFTPIALVSQLPQVLVAHPSVPAGRSRELIEAMKRSPGRLNFGSGGNGSVSHLAAELYKARSDTFAVHVPYRGGAPAITDVIGGQVDYMIDVMPNTAPQVKGGKLQALAVSTAKRVPGFDNVPTIAESGVAGFEVGAWDAIFAPKGTPAEVVDKVNAAIRKVLADTEMQNQLAARGAMPAPTTPAELRSFVSAEVDRWGKAVKQAGATID